MTLSAKIALFPNKIKPYLSDGNEFFTIQIILLLLVILISGTTEIREFTEEQKLAVANAKRNQTNIAQVITHNLYQQFERGYATSHLSERLFNSNHDSLIIRNLLGQGFKGLAFYDKKGKLNYTVGSSANLALFPTQLDIESYKKYLKDDHFALPPTTSNNDKSPVTLLLFPILNTDHQLQGMLLTGLDFNQSLQQYKSLAMGKSLALEIIAVDGTTIAKMHHGTIDNVKVNNPLISVIPENHTAGALEKSFWGESTRLISYERVSNAPFMVVVSQEKNEILSDSSARHNRYMIAILIMAFATVLILLWMLQVTKRRQFLYKKLMVSDSDKTDLIIALENEKDKAYALASHDHLTQLPNRRLFMELAESHLARAKRSRQHYAVMFIDLDRFKLINDSLGHHVGDLLLQIIAVRLKNCLRESDIVSRFGGDEFVVMLPGVDDIEHISKIAEKIIASIAQPFENLDGNDIETSCSIGIAIYPRDGISTALLIKSADDAMYRAKQSGQGRYVFFEQSAHTNSGLSFELDQRFYKAIKNGELLLHYQPKVQASDFSVLGIEALVRWKHPKHGLIFPGDFIPMLESSDKIIELGDWVINQACKQLAEWKSTNKKVVPIAINVSTKQLLDKNFVNRVSQCLSKYSLEAKDIEFEVTESCLMNDTEVSVATLNAISALGIRLSLDDFGTGFSSLGYLKALPISEIKIDRSFIRDIRNDQSDKVIVASTITLAHNLGLTVVAEGVETLEQLVHLKTAGCDVVQGYYFSRPVSPELTRLILDNGTIVPL